jgi:diacylglycerol kinase family enzyme
VKQADERGAAIFLNRGAASAGSARVRRAVELTRRRLDADLHAVVARDGREYAAWLAERVDAYSLAVIAGGDGSLGTAFNVAQGRELLLGYIPAGFGNATAHLLRLPPRPEALASVLGAGNGRALDLIRVNGRLALFAGAGWDAVVAARYARSGARRLLGWAGAIASSAGALLPRWVVRAEVDGTVVHVGPMEMAVVGTTPFYGRGMVVNPDARPDAGRLTLRVYAGPAHRLAVDAARWLAHRYPSAPAVHGTTARLVSLDGRPLPVQADGDPLGEQEEWTVEVVPGAVRIIGAWGSSPR